MTGSASFNLHQNKSGKVGDDSRVTDLYRFECQKIKRAQILKVMDQLSVLAAEDSNLALSALYRVESCSVYFTVAPYKYQYACMEQTTRISLRYSITTPGVPGAVQSAGSYSPINCAITTYAGRERSVMPLLQTLSRFGNCHTKEAFSAARAFIESRTD